MQEVLVKTHLIINDIRSEYQINWFGKIAETNPAIDENGLPIFVIVGSRGRIEMNTIDMTLLEDCAKRLTEPKGRSAITKDSSHIYIKEKGGREVPICTVVHKRVKSFSPMYDKVGYR